MKKKIIAAALAAVLAAAGTVSASTAHFQSTQANAALPAAEESYDITKPVINSIGIDKNEATVTTGDSVTVYVDAYDAGTGIREVCLSLMRFNGEYGEYASYEQLILNEETQRYETVLEIQDTTAPGKYYISDVRVTDMNGNYVYGTVSSEEENPVNAYVDTALYWYNVSDTKEQEKSDATIESVTMTKTGDSASQFLTPDSVLAAGDMVHVSLKVADKENLSDRAYMYFYTESGHNNQNSSLHIYLTYNAESEYYEGDFEITKNQYPGIYNRQYITLYDSSENAIYFYSGDINTEQDHAVGFTIENTSYDTEPPQILSVSMNKSGEIVRAGDSVTITAEVSDAASSYVEVNLTAAADFSGNYQNISLQRIAETNRYTGDFTITDETYPCEWYIDNIYVCDESGNYVREYSDPNTETEFKVEYYVSVFNGNTFVIPTCTVYMSMLDDDGNYIQETVQVPRRTTAEELNTSYAPQHAGFKFVGWTNVPQGGILNDTWIDAVYSNVAIKYYLSDESGWKLIQTEYADKGTTIELPSRMGDYQNIVWEVKEGTTITIDKDYGSAVIEIYGHIQEPEPSKKPAESKEPEVSKEPVVSKKPAESKKPVESKEPEVSKSPAESKEPVESREPEVSRKPEESKKPEISKKPEESKEPEVSKKPEESKEPEVSKKPEKSKEPEVSKKPAESKEPVESKEPEVSKKPEESKEPAESREPVETKKPIESEKSAESKEPIESKEPVVPEKPIDSKEPVFTGTIIDTITPAILSKENIEKVVSDVKNSSDGTTISVDMQNTTIVPKDVLEAIKGRNIDVKLEMDGYSWTINGTSVLSTDLTDINLEITRRTHNIPGPIVSALAGNNPVEQISLTHNGNFGFSARLTLPVGSEHAGKNGNLYYYDSDGKMVFINAGTIDENGNVSLTFSHASEYAIVITSNEAPNTKEANTNAASAPQTKDSSMTGFYIVLFLFAGTIAVIAIIRNKKKAFQ